jgi:hypothetical protein
METWMQNLHRVYRALDLLSAKSYLGFLIELIEQMLHTIKFGEILWQQLHN